MRQRGETLAPPGLRERKKEQTRAAIVRSALELFAERGYDETSIAEIADGANVSPRTVFSYFDRKEDILFCDDPARNEQLERALERRRPGVTTINALRALLASRSPAEDDNLRLRKQIVSSNERLRHGERARSARVEELIAESIARDLGAGPGDIRPPLAAAAMSAAYTTVRHRLETATGQPISHEQFDALISDVLEFVQGGLDRLERD